VVHGGRRRKRRPRGDLFRIKESYAEIDGSIALLMAVGRRQAADAGDAFDDGPPLPFDPLFA
jgi:hypothetical protein